MREVGTGNPTAAPHLNIALRAAVEQRALGSYWQMHEGRAQAWAEQDERSSITSWLGKGEAQVGVCSLVALTQVTQHAPNQRFQSHSQPACLPHHSK